MTTPSDRATAQAAERGRCSSGATGRCSMDDAMAAAADRDRRRREDLRMGDVEVHALRGVDARRSRAASSSRSWARRAPASRRCMNILGCLDAPTAGATCSTASDVAALGRRRARRRSATARSASSSRASTCSRARPRSRTSSCRCSTRGVAPRERASARGRGARARRPRRPRSTTSPSQLSGGQQQRVAIARALVDRARAAPRRRAHRQPRLAHQRRDHGALPGARTSEGITIVLVTHEPDIAAYAQPRRSSCATAMVRRPTRSRGRRRRAGRARRGRRAMSVSETLFASRVRALRAQQDALVADHARHHHRRRRGDRDGRDRRGRAAPSVEQAFAHRHQPAHRLVGRDDVGRRARRASGRCRR